METVVILSGMSSGVKLGKQISGKILCASENCEKCEEHKYEMRMAAACSLEKCTRQWPNLRKIIQILKFTGSA